MILSIEIVAVFAETPAVVSEATIFTPVPDSIRILSMIGMKKSSNMFLYLEDFSFY